MPRLYDRDVRATDRGPYPNAGRYPGVDIRCEPLPRPAAIPVEPKGELVMRCPRSRLEGHGLIVQVGAIAPGQSLATARWGIPVVAERPAAWWLGLLGTWWRDGWKDPLAPILGALLCLTAAVMLRRGI